ncbi:MAG: hypothetical protein L0207_03695 [Chlamydiae bacterium]|nr:hypothetical protein [Chlamydiota bacterium]
MSSVQPPSTPEPPEPETPKTPPPPPMPEQTQPKVIDNWVLNSPFAKMFERMGFQPTAKEMLQIINNILKQQIADIRKQQEALRQALRKMKESFEGDS